MSDLEVFTLFPLLAIEIRLMIWELAFTPQIITFKLEAGRRDEDPTAIPLHKIIKRPRRTGGSAMHFSRAHWSFRCVPIELPSQSFFQVSQEPRHLAFRLGYQTILLQKRHNLVRIFIWNPAKDFISFPLSGLQRYTSYYTPQLGLFHWPRVFTLQYPREARVVQNMVMPTSYSHSYNFQEWTSLRQLVVVVDNDYEREIVRSLIERNLAETPHWRIPRAIIEGHNSFRLRNPLLNPPNVDLRVVANYSHIFSSQRLDITLRCNPCPYLGIAREPLGALVVERND